MSKDKRSIKVYRAYAHGDQEVPEIRLKGNWLYECGFSVGQTITVECIDGKLVIQKGAAMKVAIIGSRGLSIDISPYIPTNCNLIVSGGAKGIDTLAEKYADDNRIEKLIIKPDYDKYGRSAPIRRNDIIVDSADMIIAFWDGKSRGTKYVIDYAEKNGKPIQIVRVEVTKP